MSRHPSPSDWHFVIGSDVVEAWQWIPGDPEAAGAIIGTLMGNGVPFHHPSGLGFTTTLRLGAVGEGGPLAEPGDWLIHSTRWGIMRATDFAVKARRFEGRQLPLDCGTRVHHLVQEWASSLPGGTGEIVRRKGPDHRGDFEYLVRTGADLSRASGPGNPEISERWWSSYATCRAVAAPAGGQGPAKTDAQPEQPADALDQDKPEPQLSCEPWCMCECGSCESGCGCDCDKRAERRALEAFEAGHDL